MKHRRVYMALSGACNYCTYGIYNQIKAVINDNEINRLYMRIKKDIQILYFSDVKIPKIILLISQVVDRRPINNPIQGRCY